MIEPVEAKLAEVSARIIQGDCVEVMRAMPENSVDSVVCDPPYGLEFMGKEWDRLWNRHEGDETRSEGRTARKFQTPTPQYKAGYEAQAWHEAWAREALRVLKPGGHLLAFGGTRTVHRLACAIEDAGFEIRDRFLHLGGGDATEPPSELAWIYGSGFPKSHNISKAIDKMAGAEREVVGYDVSRARPNRTYEGGAIGNIGGTGKPSDRTDNGATLTVPATEEAKQWEDWGSALKPAYEPIVCARKPLSEKNLASNVLKWGTGGLNIDASRVGNGHGYTQEQWSQKGASRTTGTTYGEHRGSDTLLPAGRFPSNLLLSHVPGAEGCQRVGSRRVRGQNGGGMNRSGIGNNVYSEQVGHPKVKEVGYADPDGLEEVAAWECVEGCPVDKLGEPARFFQQFHDPNPGFFYSPKASRAARGAGLDSVELITVECHAWDREVQKVRLPVDTGNSPPRVIAGSGIPENSASEWSTFLFGNGTTAPSLTENKSIILTGISSITASRTLQWLTRSLTRESIADANSATENGGSPVENAERSNPYLNFTSAEMVSLPGASNVPSATPWTIRGSATPKASHPTVKPLSLMRYLLKLVTPENGTCLDPFSGSGTTGVAALSEGFNAILIEAQEEYIPIIEARCAHALNERVSRLPF